MADLDKQADGETAAIRGGGEEPGHGAVHVGEEANLRIRQTVGVLGVAASHTRVGLQFAVPCCC